MLPAVIWLKLGSIAALCAAPAEVVANKLDDSLPAFTAIPMGKLTSVLRLSTLEAADDSLELELETELELELEMELELELELEFEEELEGIVTGVELDPPPPHAVSATRLATSNDCNLYIYIDPVL
jgi:hypothetical protein